MLGFVLCMFAKNSAKFLLGRVVSDIGEGFVSVLIPTFLGRSFELELQKRATIGFWSFLAKTKGTLAGPLIGNLFIHFFGWKGIFVFSLISYLVFYLPLIGFEDEKVKRVKGSEDVLVLLKIFVMCLFCWPFPLRWNISEQGCVLSAFSIWCVLSFFVFWAASGKSNKLFHHDFFCGTGPF